MTISISGYGRRSGAFRRGRRPCCQRHPDRICTGHSCRTAGRGRGAACGGAVGRRGAVTKLASHHRISRYALFAVGTVRNRPPRRRIQTADAGHVPNLALSGGTWRRHHDVGAVGFMERFARFQDPGMTSFNHYAYGAVGDWIYQNVGGIAPAEPGYRRIVVRPRPGGELSWARTSYESVYGQVATSWKHEGSEFAIDVTVPANTTRKSGCRPRRQRPSASAAESDCATVAASEVAPRFRGGICRYGDVDSEFAAFVFPGRCYLAIHRLIRMSSPRKARRRGRGRTTIRR